MLNKYRWYHIRLWTLILDPFPKSKGLSDSTTSDSQSEAQTPAMIGPFVNGVLMGPDPRPSTINEEIEPDQPAHNSDDDIPQKGFRIDSS